MPADSIMEPEGVVQASLMALRLGEVICVPFLEDASMLTESRNGAFREAMSTRRDTVAPHYR
jgi:hypothetical protein